MVTVIDRLLRSAKHEEQAYNSCKGILHLCTDVPRHTVVEAAQTCLGMSSCKYTCFKKMLNRLMNSTPAKGDSSGQFPKHGNIRGRDSYQ